MNAPATGIAVFAFLFSSALAGMYVPVRIPDAAFAGRTASLLRRSVGIIAIMAGVLLVLMTLNLKTHFDTADRDVRSFGHEVTELDHILRSVGPDGVTARGLLFRYTARTMKDIWPDTTPPLGANDAQSNKLLNALEASVSSLHPATQAQADAADDARDSMHEVMRARWRLDDRSGMALSPWTVVVLVFWLMLTFASLGVTAPRTPIAIGALTLSALALAGAVFLAVEYADPYSGLIIVSNEPLQDALFSFSD